MQSTRPIDKCFGKNYTSFLDFTRNNQRFSGQIFVPWSLCAQSDECLCYSVPVSIIAIQAGSISKIHKTS